MASSSTWPLTTEAAGGRRPGRVVDAGRTQGGQGLVEYGLILSLGAIVAMVAVVVFGDALAAALSLIGRVIDSAR
jgi:Flp pilus assembly pilin Flp